jgi:hypothetical protein
MSHVMDNQLTILKRDARGRVRSTAEARAEAVAEFRRSGLSASAFAQMAVLTRLPTLTNRQIKDVTPETWAQTRRIDGQQKAA